MNKIAKKDIKYYLLVFIETFSIWQMGIIYYSSKTLTINNTILLPNNIDNCIIFIILGYIIGIFLTYLFPKRTILFGKIIMTISTIASVTLFFPIQPELFSILYYILTFNCVLFISINTSLIVNLYSLKTAFADAVMAAITSGLFIAICQNPVIPFDFTMFNIVGTICIILVTFALFKLPKNIDTTFLSSNEKKSFHIPPKKIIFELLFIFILSDFNTLFSTSIAESFIGGISILYIGGFVGGLFFLILYIKKFKVLKLYTYFFGITAIGFLLFMVQNPLVQYIALFLQGFNLILILLSGFLCATIFEKYPSKIIAPFNVLLAFISIIIHSILIETFRESPIILYQIYSFISILATIFYYMLEPVLEINYKSDGNMKLNNLTNREEEVANLILQGLSNKEIATRLFISEYTVKEHIKKIYQKYDVHSKVALVTKLTSSPVDE